MKIITTSRGHQIMVCDCHYDLVKDYKWSSTMQGRRKDKVAAIRGTHTTKDGQHIRKSYLMHRQIMGFPEGMVVDHKDGNPSNNRCTNLRICTQGQNALNNRTAKHGSVSGHKGIYWHKTGKKWCAEVTYNKKRYYLGLFKNKLDAVEAYNKKAKELHGAFFSKS